MGERRSVGAWKVKGANIEHPTSNIQHPTSNIQRPTSNAQHPTTNIQHPFFRVESAVVVAVILGEERLLAGSDRGDPLQVSLAATLSLLSEDRVDFRPG